jgi:hypothetical protein
MNLSQDIHSLTDFKRKTPEFLRISGGPKRARDVPVSPSDLVAVKAAVRGEDWPALGFRSSLSLPALPSGDSTLSA